MKETQCNIVYAGCHLHNEEYIYIYLKIQSPEEYVRNWQQCLSHKEEPCDNQRTKGCLYIPYIIQMFINIQISGDILDIFL